MYTFSMPRKKRTEPDPHFGNTLMALRKSKGMTQTELANAIDSTQRAISYYESENGQPPIDVLIKVAKALNVSTDELLGLSPPVVEEQSKEDQRLIKKYKQLAKLPEKDQRAIFRMINSLSQTVEA